MWFQQDHIVITQEVSRFMTPIKFESSNQTRVWVIKIVWHCINPVYMS